MKALLSLLKWSSIEPDFTCYYYANVTPPGARCMLLWRSLLRLLFFSEKSLLRAWDIDLPCWRVRLLGKAVVSTMTAAVVCGCSPVADHSHLSVLQSFSISVIFCEYMFIRCLCDSGRQRPWVAACFAGRATPKALLRPAISAAASAATWTNWRPHILPPSFFDS